MYLHELPDFEDLIRIVADERKLLPELVEKDYWVTRALYGLAAHGYSFEMKGGTSLSKGYGLIHRFSEDIDIKIEPKSTGVPFSVHTGVNQTKKENHIQSRKDFYDWIAKQISIDGFESVVREESFDDDRYRSAGIALKYSSLFSANSALKDGVLLELGFAKTEPSNERPITSWVAEKALTSDVQFQDSEPVHVRCYHPGYTLVEKLQAVSTKYRQWQPGSDLPKNFMRHYYDIYRLLGEQQVIEFVGTSEYLEHKKNWFRQGDIKNISENPAFSVEDGSRLDTLEQEYSSKADMYFGEQIPLSVILDRIAEHAHHL